MSGDGGRERRLCADQFAAQRVRQCLGDAHVGEAPGQRGICRPGTAMNAKDSPGLNAQSWRTHRLQFRNTPLSEALACLERHFKVELQLVNSQLADCGISMKFEDFTLNEVLDGLTLIFNVQVYPMEGGYRLEKGSCKPAASEMR